MSNKSIRSLTEEKNKEFMDIIHAGVEKAKQKTKGKNDGIETSVVLDLVFEEGRKRLKDEKEFFLLGTMATHTILEFVRSQRERGMLMNILMGGMRPRGDNDL